MSKKLDTSGMIEELKTLTQLAKEKETSQSIVYRLGAVTIYSAMIDFILTQAARLAEQIILKSKFREGKVVFKPHEDS